MRQHIINILIILSVFCFLLVSVGTDYLQNKRMDNQDKKIDSLNILIFKRDSLHRAHLENCMFISKDQIYYDKLGYVKVKSLKRMTFDLANSD